MSTTSEPVILAADDDVMMPRMDGFEVTRRLHAEPFSPQELRTRVHSILDRR